MRGERRVLARLRVANRLYLSISVPICYLCYMHRPSRALRSGRLLISEGRRAALEGLQFRRVAELQLRTGPPQLSPSKSQHSSTRASPKSSSPARPILCASTSSSSFALSAFAKHYSSRVALNSPTSLGKPTVPHQQRGLQRCTFACAQCVSSFALFNASSSRSPIKLQNQPLLQWTGNDMAARRPTRFASASTAPALPLATRSPDGNHGDEAMAAIEML